LHAIKAKASVFDVKLKRIKITTKVQPVPESPLIERKSIKDLQSMYNNQNVSSTDLLINREVEFLED